MWSLKRNVVINRNEMFLVETIPNSSCGFSPLKILKTMTLHLNTVIKNYNTVSQNPEIPEKDDVLDLGSWIKYSL